MNLESQFTEHGLTNNNNGIFLSNTISACNNNNTQTANDFINIFQDPKATLNGNVAFNQFNRNNLPLLGQQDLHQFTSGNFSLGGGSIPPNTNNTQQFGMNLNLLGNTNPFNFIGCSNSNNGITSQASQDDFQKYIASATYLQEGDYMNVSFQSIKKEKIQEKQNIEGEKLSKKCKLDIAEEAEKIKLVNEKQCESEQNSSNNVQDDSPNKTNSFKHNSKNTYINKINSLVRDTEEIKRESRFIQSLQKEQQFSEMILKDQRMQESVRTRQNQQDNFIKEQKINQALDGNSEDSWSGGEGKPLQITLSQKLVRNRESARNSRKRKKIYIELLEKKVANMTEEIEKMKKLLESNNSVLSKMTCQTKLSGLSINQTQLLDKLEKCIQQNGEENEINLLLDSLRFRLGASGKERVAAINYFFKQIIDICIPSHFRYLLYTADAEEDMFSDNPFSDESIQKRPEWRKELIDYMDINQQQRSKIFKFKRKFQNEKKNLDNLIISLQQVKKSIQEKTIALESMVDSIRNYMNPIQSAKFLSFMEKSRYRKAITNADLWHALQSERTQDEDCDDDFGNSSNLDIQNKNLGNINPSSLILNSNHNFMNNGQINKNSLDNQLFFLGQQQQQQSQQLLSSQQQQTQQQSQQFMMNQQQYNQSSLPYSEQLQFNQQLYNTNNNAFALPSNNVTSYSANDFSNGNNSLIANNGNNGFPYVNENMNINNNSNNGLGKMSNGYMNKKEKNLNIPQDIIGITNKPKEYTHPTKKKSKRNPG